MNSLYRFPSRLDVVHLEYCDSTNSYLRENFGNLRDRLPLLVTCPLQAGGRGRDQRTWQSPKGMGLYSSFGLTPKSHSNLFLLPLIAAISVVETLETVTGIALTIKWPNDILFEGKKMAGILIENSIADDDIFCIIGIGINLNQTAAEFPDEIRHKATSLKLAADAKENYRVEDLNPILASVLFQWLKKLEGDPEGDVIKTANWYSRQLKGLPVSFHPGAGSDRISGIFKSIHNDGGLVLEHPGGNTEIYYSGEIS